MRHCDSGQQAGKMATEAAWKVDNRLGGALRGYVRQGLQRLEVLDFVQRDFPEYAWSLRTLERRLQYFGVRYMNYETPVEQVKEVVSKELEGPGQQLGYRALHNKIRQVHGLFVPRDLVHNIMYDLDPDALEARKPNTKKALKKGNYSTVGTNWVHSVDGHDKLMGYQNSTFPLAIYGCMDTCSRKLLWLRIWTTNSNPSLVGKWYLDYLRDTKVMSQYIRADRGTETGVMCTIHAYLLKDSGLFNEPTEAVIFGPSTSNKIERWWRELHERLEKYFKVGLTYLTERLLYDPQSHLDRSILAFVMIPVLERELNHFKDVIWNSHRIRHQRNTIMPDGIPNHVHEFPEKYGLEQCGIPVSEEQLDEVAEFSEIPLSPCDFIDREVRCACELHISDPHAIETKDYVSAYRFLKDRVRVAGYA